MFANTQMESWALEVEGIQDNSRVSLHFCNCKNRLQPELGHTHTQERYRNTFGVCVRMCVNAINLWVHIYTYSSKLASWTSYKSLPSLALRHTVPIVGNNWEQLGLD